MAHKYADWSGAGEVVKSMLFTTDTHQELNPAQYPGIMNYMPSASGSAARHVLIGRAPVQSKRIAGAHVVKLFSNGTLKERIEEFMAEAEFTSYERSMHRLVSDIDVNIVVTDPGEEQRPWRSVGKMVIYRDLDPPARPVAMVEFQREGESVSAFWCWPD